MNKNRVEAFSDGIMAIIITLLVLNLSPPLAGDFSALSLIQTNMILYIYSFILIAIYWNNHHHLFQMIKNIDGTVLWANNIFLFMLTLFPFGMSWVSNNFNKIAPQIIYGGIILLANLSFLLLMIVLKRFVIHDEAKNINYKKSFISIGLNVMAIIIGCLILPQFVFYINILVIIIWILPSKKSEELLK